MVKTRNYDQEFELEKLKLQMEAKRQEREHIEKLEKNENREGGKRKRKTGKRKRERQERERERQFELEKLKLQQSNHPIGQSFDVIKNFQAVPSFQEDDVDMFFLHFEKLATNLDWPKDHWTILLQKAIDGKAREIFAQLSVEQSQKYEYVKDVVLRGYQLNPEAYCQKFRNCQRDISQTFVEFARVKEQLFDRWCHSKKVNKDLKSFGSSF